MKIKKILVIVLGTISWSLTMVKSGLIYPFGMGFWGANGHDGVWHIALINSLAKGFFNMPVFAGEILKNYHIGFDFLVAFLHKITLIPVVTLYFQIVPPILAFLVGVLTYKFVLEWRKSEKAAFWSTFFVYFGASFGWIINLLRGKGMGGESMFWSQQGISSLINPPFALSLAMILAGLIFLLKLLKKFSWTSFIFATLFLGLTFEVKVYAGILLLGGLLVATLKNRKIFWIFLSALTISLILFFAFNRGGTTLLVFKPFWFLETMMGLSDRLYWPRFYSAMTNYKLGRVWLKEIPAYLVAFAIFYVGNMGTRLIKGFAVWKRVKDIKLADSMDFFFASIIVAGTVIPMFFLQEGTPWNTIQFFYYSLFAASILAGVAMPEILALMKTKIQTAILVTGVVLLTIPTTIGTLVEVYLPIRPPAKISNEELSALNFLAKQKEGTVLTYPFDRLAAQNAVANPPRPLYLYESTAYVSAFSGKPVFLEDEVNLDITGCDWRARRKLVEEFYASQDHALVGSFLKKNNINYVYWLKGQRATLGESQLGIKKIFENNAVDIFKVE
ncbi:hypothetical protein MUP46_02935 [Patescibacteria group bacterium]|nr:hypothetical protein [Patescibacteria group bacterium]